MIVYGEGKKESKLWIIGECPGAQEEKTGRPFVGGAGRILDGILQEAGIERGDCYIDNVVRKRPPKNDFGVYYQDKGRHHPTVYLSKCQELLREMVAGLRPNVVVALGNEALSALLERKAIMKWRGSILGCRGVKVIPTIHPAMVMRQYEFKPISVLDFKRIKEESLTPDFPRPYKDNFIIDPTYEQVIHYLNDVLPNKPTIAFDIETAENQIVCIGFGWSKEDAICIPIFFSNNSWWNKEEELAIIRAVKHLFSITNIKFIAQNAQFDMIYLADRWGVEVKNLWMDTMVAFHCVYPELRKGLDFLSSIYTKRPYYKDMPGSGGGPEILWRYNCLDTVVTWECAMKIREELNEFKTLEFYEKHSHRLIKPLIKMQRRGVRIDVNKREEIDKNLSKEEEELQERLNRVVGHELNPNSPKQMKEFLYNELKLPPQRHRKTEALTADVGAIEKLAKRFPSPVFDLILDVRKVRKILSTYIRASLDEDKRMRCSYVITGTETGRLSSRESVYGRGTNLQNIPRGDIVRSIFIPDEGKQFVNADLSQAEARVVAYLSKEERLQALFDKEGDVHTKNASMVFGKIAKDVTSEERTLAKRLVHAANYGIGERTFARHVGTSENKARELLNQYYAIYPSIKLWHRQVEATLRSSRILRTPLGRARQFFGRWGPDLIREGLAYIPQSTVSDILNWGIIRSANAMPPGWELVLQLHDAVLMQVPLDADPMHIWKFIKHYFEISIEIERERLKIPVDIKIGPNWSDLKKLEEPWKQKSAADVEK